MLPVVPQKSQKEVVGSSLVSSWHWPHLINFRLTENIRAREDPTFAAFLLALGNGELQTKENAVGLINRSGQVRFGLTISGLVLLKPVPDLFV